MPATTLRLVALSSTARMRTPVDVDQRGACVGGEHRGWVLLLEAGSEPERRPAARLALDADPAAHELDEAPADGQPQAGAAEAPRGGSVGLREGLEQHVDLLGR